MRVEQDINFNKVVGESLCQVANRGEVETPSRVHS